MAYTKFLFCMGVVVMFAACGDDGSSTNAVEMDASFDASKFDVVVATKDELPKCTDKRDGEKAYVKDKKVTYVCDVGRWVLDDEGKSSSISKEEKGRTISGVAQKGPFLAQSAVKIYELDPKTLAKTGKVFSGEVDSSGDGRFKVPNVELSSPYALFEVKGKFRNEVTGEMSSNDITLHALVNLEDRKEVNINLLTHLTYERILYLFGTGVDFAKAKKQAETEISKAFYLGDEFENFEDMNIFGDGEESAALLAVSVLVLDGAGKALTEFLDAFVDDFRKDGSWDDKITRYNVETRVEYMGDDVERIRNNIVDWKVGSVPKFGKYIRKIKCGSRNLDKCYEECDVEGAIIRSEYSWKLCLDGVLLSIDKTYGWSAGTDGELRKSDSTHSFYKYDEVLKEWDYIDENDSILGLNGCTAKREGEVGLSPKDSSYYVCKHIVEDGEYEVRVWWKAQEIDFIRRDEKCEREDIGRIIAGIDTVTNKYYCSANGWVDFMAWSFGVPKEFRFNPDIDYGTMTDSRDGKKYRTVNIGEQVWMAENLNYYAGDRIGHCYDDDPENCEVGGRLYKWDVAKDVCPEGWHLPSKEEFEILFSAVQLVYDKYDKAQYSFADMFKATSGWKNDNSSWTQGLDKVGFSAVPAGGKRIKAYRSPEYTHAGYTAFFLTSTEYSETSVYVMRVGADVASLSIDDYFEVEGPCYSTKESGYSVRCLKDATSPVVP